MKVKYRTVEEYIKSLIFMDNIESAKEYLLEIENKTGKNYEIFAVEKQGQIAYVVCESQYWETVSRYGYTMADYDI